ncbi:MAG: cupin domain-containing protein [Steroidobacteraceae bacterium]|jgi:hypothetical protein|nr:cupin domain-containing protein [Steroidobacteraceae bacterium]
MSKAKVATRLGDDGPVLADTRAAKWHALGDGIEIQVLRLSRVTGEWALYVRMQPGSRIVLHRHLSPGEFFVTKGELKYDVGSAPAGTYGYEATFEVHGEARADELTEYLFLGRGAVAYPGPDGRIDFVLDAEFLERLVAGESLQAVTVRTGTA